MSELSSKEAFIEELKRRTKKLALAIIDLSKLISNSEEGHIIKRQIIRSATSGWRKL